MNRGLLGKVMLDRPEYKYDLKYSVLNSLTALILFFF